MSTPVMSSSGFRSGGILLRSMLGPGARRRGIMAGVVTMIAVGALADEVDDVVAKKMRAHGIPGLSLAIIQDGKIIKAQGYGFTDRSSQTAVTTNTLFQAGSVSKSVAALGALHLAQAGKLFLDANVNAQLHSWKVPDNKYTQDEKVTLRRILSHSAGLTVHGFPGYATNDAVPTLVQVLDGAKPANTAPIEVDTVPGTQWRYSGGGYTVMQQLVVDTTGKPFPEFMSETVLKPLGMMESTYEQPLPTELRSRTATGHFSSRYAVPGRWHIYPEMAAAGLWTTPTDLARFAIGVQEAYAGRSTQVVSQATAKLMLTEALKGDGLGVFLDGSGETLRFSHDGRDAGFDTLMIAYVGTGRGAVIMMNLNDNAGTAKAIINAITKKYSWSSGLAVMPPAWQRTEILNALLHPRTKGAAIGRVCVLAGLLMIAILIGRRVLRRPRSRRNTEQKVPGAGGAVCERPTSTSTGN